MVGTLLEIGRGEFSLEELEQSFASNELPEFITTAYPQGLYLSKVTYRYLDIAPRIDFSFLQNVEDDWLAI